MSKKTNGKKGNTKTTNGKKESKNMAAKKNGKEEVKGLNLPEMRKFAKSFGIKVTGRGQAEVLGEVLTAIEAAYGAAEEDAGTFEAWKTENKAMIQFHIDNQEAVPATEPVPESPPEKVISAEETPEEVHAVVNKKGAALAKAKAKAAAAKGKVAGKKAEKKEKKMTGVRAPAGTGIGAFIREGLKKGTFKGKTNKEIAEIVVKKFPGAQTNGGCVSWYANKMKQNNERIVR